MNKYLIAYDLKGPDKNSYTGLYEAIKGISGLWWHYLDTVWIVKNTSLTADEISARIKPHFNIPGDNFLVIKIDAVDKQGWLHRTAWDWLNDQAASEEDARRSG